VDKHISATTLAMFATACAQRPEEAVRLGLQAMIENKPLGESSLDGKIVVSFQGVELTEANFRETITLYGQKLKRHRNGGGWVPVEQDEHDESKPYVAESACIGPLAMVFGNARVLDHANVTESARVQGNAKVSGYAQIFGHAGISGCAKVSGYAKICEGAQVFGEAVVTNAALISDGARVYGNALVWDNAQVSGCAVVVDRAVVSGHTQLFGYARVQGEESISKGTYLTRADVEQYLTEG